MSDTTDDFKALQEEHKQLRRVNNERAEKTFPAAAAACSEIGLTLTRLCAGQFRLAHPSGWHIDFYPGNGRIYSPIRTPRAPFLKMPEDWRLADIADAVKLMQMEANP